MNAKSQTKDNPIAELPLERFRRICGLFDAVAPQERIPIEVANEFVELRKQMEADLDLKTGGFQRPDAADLVHNLNLLFTRVAPITMLRSFMHANREDFREAIGEEAYQRYLASDGYRALADANVALSPEAREAYARSDALYVINETRRQTLAQGHIEDVRSFLVRTLGWSWARICIPLAIIVLACLVVRGIGDRYLKWEGFQKDQLEKRQAYLRDKAASEKEAASMPGEADAKSQEVSAIPAPAPATPDFGNTSLGDVLQADTAPSRPAGIEIIIGSLLVLPGQETLSRYPATPLLKAFYGITVLALASIAGATGSFVSVMMRVLAATDSSRLGRNLVQFQNSKTVVMLGPVSGAIFAMVISALFSAELLSGSVFPKLPDHYPWFWVLYLHTELCKWMIWAFLAGFSERLVPDMLDRLTSQVKRNDLRDPAIIAPAASLEPVKHPDNAAGAPPAAPDGVVLQKIEGNLRASWPPVAGAIRYRPYRQIEGMDAGMVALPEISGTELTLSGLPAAGTLKFHVKALNAAGESPMSAPQEIRLG